MSKRNQGAGPSQSNTLFNYFEAPKKKARKSKRDFEMSEHKSREGRPERGPEEGEKSPEKTGKAEKSYKPGGKKLKKKSPKPGPSNAPDTESEEEAYRPQYRPRNLPLPPTDNDSSQCSSTTTTEVDAGPSASVEEMDVDVHSESDEDVVKPKKRNRIKVMDDSSESDGATPKKAKRDPDPDDSDDDKDPKKLLKGYVFQKGTPNKEPTEPTPQKKKVRDVVRDIHSNWPHNDLEFLKPDRIRDANKRKPDDPEYNPHTLYVPEQFLKGLTPAMRQWWELKSQHLDSVLLFKVGKFYELYHMDAVVGVLHLGFSYMKGDFAHSGFPESAYAKMTSALIDKGFKVARVEQTETPEMMAVRCKSQKSVTKFDKVVKREVCQVTTKATCVYTAQMPEARNEMPNYMYAICMKQSSAKTRFGVCFTETSIGTFYLSEFDDDKYFSRLLALLAEYPASLILHERGAVSKKFSDMMNSYFKDIRKDALSKSQFFNASDTLEKLSMACYFRDKEGNLCWPPLFKKIADDCLPKTEYELSIRSLGACMWYLKDSKLDIQVFSAGKFEWYDPLDLTSKENKAHKEYLILDSSTIHNLSLLGGKGSLQHVLDHCETAFGKRMLQRWICRPLCDIDRIKERQSAVTELWKNPDLLKSAKNVLKKMPDLERQLTKIHAYGNRFIATDHPDSRAIFYEAVRYSKTKIRDFLKTLRALEKAQDIADIFNDCESRLLKKITQFSPKGKNVDLRDTLQFFKTAFDQVEAEKEGKIIPKRGVEEEFDRVEEKIEDINKKLSDYLDKQSKFFGCKITYFGNDKKRFQLDVPDNRTDRVTNEYLLEGTKKGARPTRRYSTPRTRELLAEMLKAESEKAKIILDLNRRIFEKFSERYDEFDQAIQCLTILDALCSLAEYARTYSQDICMPEVEPFSEKPKLVIQDGRHPCITNIDSFVPNDTELGVANANYANVLILTGPNMGGKSTLMRQAAVISIMAQLGSCVPAYKCRLNLVDRVFTRLGAHDDIVQGQSTFFVELSEASSILQHATKHSLVLIDELGRGTSTHDGNAVATAYLKKLISVGCRTLFATHYHSLIDNFVERDDIQLGHMACMVENDDDPTLESVTLLYKMAKGRCPKSYGFNAARLAGLDRRIVVRGREIAKSLEEESRFRNVFHSIFTEKNMWNVRELLASLL